MRPFFRGSLRGTRPPSIADAIGILRNLFVAGAAPLGCEDAADVDDNGELNITDAVYLLTYLFKGGPAPPAPYPDCGVDLTEDTLGCADYPLICAGDSFIFVVDRSSSFTGLPIAKREVSANVAQFSELVQLGLIFFATDLVRFPGDGPPAYATPKAKKDAKAFIQSVATSSGSCVKDGLLAALDLADLSTSPGKIIVYLGDGGGTCRGGNEADYLKETLDAVKARNTSGVRINSVEVGNNPALNEDFLKQLAAFNGGTYTRILR